MELTLSEEGGKQHKETNRGLAPRSKRRRVSDAVALLCQHEQECLTAVTAVIVVFTETGIFQTASLSCIFLRSTVRK